MSVLDVGCIDGFYAFLAEQRGPSAWWRSTTSGTASGRFAVGRRAAGRRRLPRSPSPGPLRVECRRMDAFALDGLEEEFDLVYCFGIPYRVENPLGLLRVLRGRTVSGGMLLVETYGVGPEDRNDPAIRIPEPREVYARDEFVYWGLRRRCPAAACADRRLLARGVVRQRADRRPAADHRPAGRPSRPVDGGTGTYAGRSSPLNAAFCPLFASGWEA